LNILKQTLGIDVSMDDFEARFGTIDTLQGQEISKSVKFDNNLTGFKKFLKWAINNKVSDCLPIVFVMEVTGVYHENLAHFLHKNGHQVVIVLSNKIRNYAKSLESKSKTDPIDAAVITRFGLERKLDPWTPPEPFLATLRALSREYHSLKELATEIKNQLHAKAKAFSNDFSTIKRKRKLLNTLDKQIKEILSEINQLIKAKPELYKKLKKVATIKGVGEITIITILAETNCFEHVSNIKQLISYAGLDVVLNQSGKKKGKTTISKRGNKFIRKALFMPAMSACKHNLKMKQVFARLVTNGKNKKAAIIAIARKLLVLIYTLWSNDSVFIQDYQHAKTPIKLHALTT
jgi:transposase